MTDAEFLAGFEDASLTEFPHASHLRMAWLVLRRDGPAQGTARILEGLQRFATAKGAPEMFHVTLTRFWVDAVERARAAHPEADTFEALLAASPHLASSKLVFEHYSPERLWSDEARAAYVAPDKRPLS